MGRSTEIPARFEALDALRGICALLVVLFHIPIYHALKDVAVFVNLQACVDVFFVLSGFVLCHAYAPKLSRGEPGATRWLVAKRIARLWPLHAAILAVLVVLETVKFAFERGDPSFEMLAQSFGEGRTVFEIVTNLAFLQSFGLHPGLTWNGPAWSVAVEFYLSILFALLVPLPGLWRRLVFVGIAVGAWIALFTVSPATLFVSTDWGILRAALGFFGGCLLYDLRASSPERLTKPGSLETASLALLILCGLLIEPGPWQYLFPIACGCLVLVFSYGQGPISRALGHPALQALGLWSYSIYMIHTTLFQFGKSFATFVANKTGLALVVWHKAERVVLVGSPMQALVPTLILCVVLVVPVAALTYRFIERPGTLLFGRFFARRLGADAGVGKVPAPPTYKERLAAIARASNSVGAEVGNAVPAA